MNNGTVTRTVVYTCEKCDKEVTETNPHIKKCDSFGSYGETVVYVVCPLCHHEDEVWCCW